MLLTCAPRALAGLVITAMFSSPAGAVLLNTPSAVPANASTVDFAQFAATGRIVFGAAAPPFVIDDLANEPVVMRAVSGSGSIVALIAGDHTPPEYPDNNFYLGPNGYWGPGRAGFLGTDGESALCVVRIEFTDRPVALVGGLFNYSPTFPDLTITALGEDGSILEQYAINSVAPISTPQMVDVGEFRGIRRDENDIFALQMTARYAVVDDIRFSRVPEPNAIALSAFAVFLLLVRRTEQPSNARR
jgi:hypothetical protein